MSYNSKYKGVEVDALLDKVNGMGDIPTKVSELENDSGYVNENQVNTKLTSKQDKVSVVDHGTEETTFTLTPNTLHIWGEVASLSLDFGESVDGSLSEYMFRFSSGATPTTLTLPDSVSWANGMEVSIQSGKTYKVAIIDGYGCILEFETIVANTTFTYDGKEYSFDTGMTWEQWVNSEYNTDGFEIHPHFFNYNEKVVYTREEGDGFSGRVYYIADPNKADPNYVLNSDDIIGGVEYITYVLEYD